MTIGTCVGLYRKRLRDEQPHITITEQTLIADYGVSEDGRHWRRWRNDDVWEPVKFGFRV